MSNSSVSRYDKYIPLFSHAGDRRVRLWLHTIENQNKKYSGLQKAPYSCDQVNLKIDLRDKKGAKVVPRALAKESFKTASSVPNEVHDEWAQFFADINASVASKNFLPGTSEHNLLKQLARACDGGYYSDLLEMIVHKLLIALKPTIFDLAKKDLAVNGLSGNLQDITLSDNLKGKMVSTLPSAMKVVNRANFFNIELNHYLVKNFLDEAADQPQSLSASTKIFEGALSVEDEYVRTTDGQLFKKDVNAPGGKRHVGNEDLTKLTVEDKCFNTGVKDTSNSTCANYLDECLQGSAEGIEKCKNYMKDHTFYENAANEVNNMLPQLMIKTLQSFDFKVRPKKLSSGATVNLFENWKEWIAGLKKLSEDKPSELAKKEFERIRDNAKLQDYLEKIVARVNANPAMFNTNYQGPSNVSFYETNVDAKTSILARYGLKPHQPQGILSSALRIGTLVRPTILSAPAHARGIVLLGPGSMRNQMGGAYVNYVEKLQEMKENDNKQSWSMYHSHYLNIVNRLKVMRKEISPADHEQIMGFINKLKENEQKLLTASLYAEKYAQLLEVFEQQDPSGQLSLDQLQQFVDARNKYFEKVTTRRNALTSIIETVTEIAAKGMNEEVVPLDGTPSNKIKVQFK